jgi:hypothetical protein
MKIIRGYKAALGYTALALFIVLSASFIVYPAVTQIAGLAVAQSSTRWNNLKDFAFGDSVTNGVMLQSPCLYNGTSCDRQRGTIANGAQVDVTRISGAVTPADNYANPTTANQMWSLLGVTDAAGTWDKVRSANSDNQAVPGVIAVNPMIWNQATSTFDLYRGPGPTQGGGPNGSLFNSTTTGGANTVVTVTVTGAASTRIRSANVSAFCSAGTATLTLIDGGTTRWTSPTGAVGTALFTANFAGTPFTAGTGNNFVANLTACGAGNTGTVNVQASRF